MLSFLTPGSWLAQFVSYATIGLGSAVVDFAIYITLTRGFPLWSQHLLWANAVAFLFANFNSFYWNRRFTFAGSGSSALRQYLPYLAVSLLYLGAIQLGLWFAVSRLGLYDLLAKVLVLGLAALLYFTVLRRWVFRRRESVALKV